MTRTLYPLLIGAIFLLQLPVTRSALTVNVTGVVVEGVCEINNGETVHVDFGSNLQANQIMRGVQLGLKDQVLNSRSIWMCLSCSTCSLRCPNNIDVAEVMETLRHMARKEGRVAVPKVEKFWFSFLDTVRKFGRTYEIGTMVLYMLRSLRVFTDVDLAPQALAKQKLGFKPHSIPNGGAEAVGRIMTRYKERAKREGVRP